jgi:deoxyribonuclease-4
LPSCSICCATCLRGCIDTCHTHVAGYDIVSKDSHDETLDQLDPHHRPQERARLALQDAKAERGSSLTRSAHREGKHRPETFRRLLNDKRLVNARLHR